MICEARTSTGPNWTASAVVIALGLSAAPPAVLADTKLDVAIIGEPDTLDPMLSTKDIVSIVIQHFVETLYAFDASWNVVPLLAVDLPEISDNGKTYRVKLRDGITFHEGSSMDSADVVASLKRWTRMASRGRGVADRIAGIEAVGANIVEIRMNEPYSPLLSLLAFSNSAAAVYPEEILGETLSAVIGTGPYKLIEHLPDQYLQLCRFGDYQPRDEAPNGAAGGRLQVPDKIRFVPVPDANTRVEGLLSGQYDYADVLPAEALSRITENAAAEPVLLRPFGWPIFAINHKDGLLTDIKIRKALQTALPHDDMLFAAFGDENFLVVDAPMYPEGWVWRNDAGTEAHNQNDLAKAAEYLKAAGYDGTPLRILTSRQYEFHFKMAEVAKVALEAAGFNVQMDVVDWATSGQRRNDPALWDIYITHLPFLPEPALTSLYSPTSRLGWAEPGKDETLATFTTTTDQDQRLALFADLQEALFDDVGFVKIGGFNALQGQRTGLTGVNPSPWPHFWNAKVD